MGNRTIVPDATRGEAEVVKQIVTKLSNSFKVVGVCTKESAVKRIAGDVNGDIGRHMETALRALPSTRMGDHVIIVGETEKNGTLVRLRQPETDEDALCRTACEKLASKLNKCAQCEDWRMGTTLCHFHQKMRDQAVKELRQQEQAL